ncbi:hypothetical protein KY316_02655 [Candidatus Woesearchaeota archaeon]|nr:hypothetical protein [Candidatus Woesearchaeota archaeon]
MAMYKQKCAKCKKNFVLMTSGNQFPICYDCQKEELSQPIKDPEMKKLFDIPEDFYRQSTFLRNIKSTYLRFGKLTEKQIEAFKKTVQKMKS